MAEHEDERVSAGYRALGDESPPEALDAAILAASRRAVGAGPGRLGSGLRRWAMPVSIAAVVVLTVSVVVRMQLERPELESPLPLAGAPPVPKVARDADEKDAPKPARTEAKEEVAKLAKKSEPARALDKAKAGAPSSTTASAVPPPAVASAAPPSASVASAASVSEREQRARQATPAPAAPPAPESRPTEQPRFAPEPPARAPAPAESVAAAPAPSAEMRLDTGLAALRGPETSSAPAPASAGRSESRLMAEDRVAASAESTGKKSESPRDWLERIAKLRREGRVKDADESLAEFRRRYPDYEIPKELRDAVIGPAR